MAGRSRSPYRSLALILRGRSGLTQRELADHLGVSERAIQRWEAGRSHPTAGHLKHLISLYLQRGVFTAGREAEEVTALWEALRRETTRRVAPFDRAWFAALPGPPPAPTTAAARAQRQEWGEAPEPTALINRADELAALSRWLLEERCRLVAVLGPGGVGKTVLAARLARDVAPHFDVVCWCSLRNAPPLEEWLAETIRVLEPALAAPPVAPGTRLRLLMALLRERRALLVLDNLETILHPGEPRARYREGYEGYGEALRQVGESAHQACMLVTGREEPPELALFAGDPVPVRTLRLGGLGTEAAWALLQGLDLTGDAAAWQELVRRYGGNPLALTLVGPSVAQLFGRDLGAFLAYTASAPEAVFGGVRQLLEEQFARLSAVERSVAYWLAIKREAVGPEEFAAPLGRLATRGDVLDALEALRRRSFLAHGAQAGTLTLQSPMLEYAILTIGDRPGAADHGGPTGTAGPPSTAPGHGHGQTAAPPEAADRPTAPEAAERPERPGGGGAQIARPVGGLVLLPPGQPTATGWGTFTSGTPSAYLHCGGRGVVGAVGIPTASATIRRAGRRLGAVSCMA